MSWRYLTGHLLEMRKLSQVYSSPVQPCKLETTLALCLCHLDHFNWPQQHRVSACKMVFDLQTLETGGEVGGNVQNQSRIRSPTVFSVGRTVDINGGSWWDLQAILVFKNLVFKNPVWKNLLCQFLDKSECSFSQKSGHPFSGSGALRQYVNI